MPVYYKLSLETVSFIGLFHPTVTFESFFDDGFLYFLWGGGGFSLVTFFVLEESSHFTVTDVSGRNKIILSLES